MFDQRWTPEQWQGIAQAAGMLKGALDSHDWTLGLEQTAESEHAVDRLAFPGGYAFIDQTVIEAFRLLKGVVDGAP